MFDKTKVFVKRIRVRVAPVLAASAVAVPVFLDQVGLLDMKPILAHVVGEGNAPVAAFAATFAIAMMKSMIHLTPETEETEDDTTEDEPAEVVTE